MDYMENAEKDCSVLGNLFQTIVNDLRVSSPIWEDFIYKSTKLHQCLKTTLVAISGFLEAFQKVADMATNSKGATKEIGSALTRLCMRHRSIESCLKALTSSILDSLVAPLQERLEDWKKAVAQVDKDHAKEYKKARQEIKKAASDTMRLQKKVRKGLPHGGGKKEMEAKLDYAMQDVNTRYQQLEEIEKNSVRTALIEERSRFCHFISCVKPFVDHEIHLLTEVTHLQEIMHSLCLQASEPQALPESSEQVINDLKGVDPATLNLSVRQLSPPSSPSSLGSRKSSMCSINSINSSSSGSSKSHSPSHTMHKRTASQAPGSTERLTSVSSQDSGFTSQDTLFMWPATPMSLNLYQASNSDRDSTGTDTADCDSTPTTPSAHFVATPTASTGSTNSLPAVAASQLPKIDRARPHTISGSSEKAYSRMPLKPELFEPLPEKCEGEEGQGRVSKSRPQSTAVPGRPAATINKMQPVLPPHCPRPKAKAVAPPSVPQGSQPVYANTVDLQKRIAMVNQTITDGGPGEITLPVTGSGHVQPAPSSEGSALNALDLEEAIRSLTDVTAGLITKVPEEEAAALVAAQRAADEKKEEEEIELRRSCRSQKMQQNSLELAAAIRELEASTAALQSSYDPASHTSHTSLQCSSGYATMNSTPSGSEDTIASGDCDLSSELHESEKYFTIPRSGELSAAFRQAMFAKRPASTAGVPASGINLSRRSSVNTTKPPPPVRRTTSINCTSRQFSDGGSPDSLNGQGEGPYAELQLIQQNIQQQQKKGQQHQAAVPATAPKPGQLQRQFSGEGSMQQYHPSSCPSPDRISISSNSSTGSGHYAVPSIVASSPGSAQVLQSLNAKFASLNEQYQDGQFQQQFALPSNGGTYVGNMSGGLDPVAANLMPPPPLPGNHPPPGQQRGQGQGHAGAVVPGTGLYGHMVPGPGSHPVLADHEGQMYQGQSNNPAEQSYCFPNQGYSQPSHIGQQPGRLGYSGQQPSQEEDFPLPPSAEELAEIENIYSRGPPPVVNPKPKFQGNQSLMMELKKRVSHDETTDV